MNPKVFAQLVELRTKLASLLPFLVGVSFAAVQYHQLSWLNTAIFFIAMSLFDMATTAINNLMDYRKARDQTYRKKVNVIGREHLSVRTVSWLSVLMVGVATCLGIWLVWRTDLFLLIIGSLCFAIGLSYTMGPMPLSRLPLGEIFSGITMGLLIPFIAVYINVADQQLISLTLHWPGALLMVNIWQLLGLGLVCLPSIGTIANVMLANNLSDLAEDAKNKRHTLPSYLGVPTSLRLYHGLIAVGYFGIMIGMVLRLIPWSASLIFLSVPMVIYNNRRFATEQSKTKTFKTSISNLVWVNSSLLVGLILGLLVK